MMTNAVLLLQSQERFEKLTMELKNAVEQLEQTTRRLEEEKKRSDALLYLMLPPSIADDLRHGKKVEAIDYPSTTILFSDIVGFTQISARCTAREVRAVLHHSNQSCSNQPASAPRCISLQAGQNRKILDFSLE